MMAEDHSESQAASMAATHIADSAASAQLKLDESRMGQLTCVSPRACPRTVDLGSLRRWWLNSQYTSSRIQKVDDKHPIVRELELIQMRLQSPFPDVLRLVARGTFVQSYPAGFRNV